MILTPDDGDARALRRSVRLNNLASLTSVLLSGAALLVPLDRVPVVVVTATSYGKCYSRDVTPSAATIKCQTDLLSSAPSDAFLGFTFVAIAHKPPDEES